MRKAGRRVASLALLGVLASCGVSSTPPPDFHVRGVGVVVDSTAPFTLQADLPARIESTVDAALTYWGGSWQTLEGVTITLDGDRYVACAGATSAV
ncbi:MAG TPA: hypothetical protein VFR85_17900, partial [Anaeromyxobacteraceae bacterium]|nr:hypothetical protein [Anaeromyxobacteraceae bacterium]